MPEAPEVWKSAEEMIERYGDDALREINLRIEELDRMGEVKALRVWLQIRSAAEALIESRGKQPT